MAQKILSIEHEKLPSIRNTMPVINGGSRNRAECKSKFQSIAFWHGLTPSQRPQTIEAYFLLEYPLSIYVRKLPTEKKRGRGRGIESEGERT